MTSDWMTTSRRGVEPGSADALRHRGEDFRCFLRNAVQEILLLANAPHVHVEHFGDALFRKPALDGLQNHNMLLNGGHTVHTLVVRVRLVIGGDEEAGVCMPKLLQSFEPNTPIRQAVFLRVSVFFQEVLVASEKMRNLVALVVFLPASLPMKPTRFW